MMAQAKKMDTGEEDLKKSLEKSAKEWADKRIAASFSELPSDMMPSDKEMKEMKDATASDRLKRLLRSHRHDDALDRLWDEKSRELVKALSDWKAGKIEEELKEEIKKLEDSDYYEEKLERGLAISAGQRNITWRKALPEPHHIERYKEDKRAVKAQISKLRKKVQLYGNLQKHNIYNQKRGILDKRQLHRIPMGMTDIFKAVIIQEDKPLDICILVDESGSMGAYCMQEARQSAIAIKEALCDNPMIDLWVYGHSADGGKHGDTEMIEYWSPSMKDRPMAMGSMRARVENRDGNAIVASAHRVKGESMSTTNKLMIVLSDGAPSANAYRGAVALDHVKKCVKHIESQGWSVIQVGFSGSTTWSMERMFKNYIYVENITKIGDMLSKIIRKVIKV
jgi:nitric oxide reductase activation protein